MLQGPQFLKSNQIVEIKSEEQAFGCSSFVYDLFVAAKSINKKNISSSCCGTNKSDSNTVNSACCGGKTTIPSAGKSVTKYFESNVSPVRSVYINERTLTVNISENYISDRFACNKADSEGFEACANALWSILKDDLLQVVEKHIIQSSDSEHDETLFSGFIQTLDPSKDMKAAAETLPQSLWSSATEDTEINFEDSEPVMAVKELIRQRVKPILEQDGGSCRFIGMVEDGDIFYDKIIESHQHLVVSDTDGPFSSRKLEVGSVLVMLEGACVGCPSSSFTLKNSVQRMLTHWVPEVTQVVEVDEDFVRSVMEGKKQLGQSKK